MQSVCAGLAAVHSEYVAVHDAARPFVSAQVISAALEAACETGAAAPAVPVKDTVKRAKNGIVAETPPRAALFCVQTPQCFRTALYRELLARGVNMVIYANQLLRASYPMMEKTARSILEHHRALESEDMCMSIKHILSLLETP